MHECVPLGSLVFLCFFFVERPWLLLTFFLDLWSAGVFQVGASGPHWRHLRHSEFRCPFCPWLVGGLAWLAGWLDVQWLVCLISHTLETEIVGGFELGSARPSFPNILYIRATSLSVGVLFSRMSMSASRGPSARSPAWSLGSVARPPLSLFAVVDEGGSLRGCAKTYGWT